uniref:C-type lectin domain-containing protein n=1 Tax=Xiphophorus maculatus TaxID=8083 RepID=A0A3B5PXC5_XIPMA
MLVSVSLQVLIRFCSKCSSGENPSRTCRISAGGVVLLVLVGLLAAALIIYRLCEFILINFSWILLYQKLKSSLKSSCLKCEPGWELNQNNCYYFNTNKSSWTDSRRSCADLGSDLVKIHSREEQAFLARKVTNMMEYNNDMFWIGLTDSEVEGRWSWIDGSPLDESYTPDDWKGSRQQHPEGEDCATMGTKLEPEKQKCWADVFCFLSQKSICEKSPETGQTFCV